MRVHDSVDDLIADVDAVAFAVPPTVQGELAPRAASAGKHLILEKPLAADLAGAQVVADAVAAAGVVSTMVLTLRHDAEVREWLTGLPDRPAGPDTVGVGRWFSGAVLGGPFSASPWRSERGALLDVGPHVIDLLDVALGPVDRVAWANLSDPDLWSFGMQHAGGATSTVTASLRLPIDPSEFEIGLFGGIGRQVLTARPDDPTVPYGVLLDEFVAAIERGSTNGPCSAARGLHLQRIIEQVAVLVRAPDRA